MTTKGTNVSELEVLRADIAKLEAQLVKEKSDHLVVFQSLREHFNDQTAKLKASEATLANVTRGLDLQNEVIAEFQDNLQASEAEVARLLAMSEKDAEQHRRLIQWRRESEAGAAALREALTKCASVLAALSDQVASLGYDCLRSVDSAAGADMLAEVERLREENGRLKQACDIFEKNSADAIDLEREVERLRAEVEQIPVYRDGSQSDANNIDRLIKQLGQVEARAEKAEAEVERLRSQEPLFHSNGGKPHMVTIAGEKWAPLERAEKAEKENHEKTRALMQRDEMRQKAEKERDALKAENLVFSGFSGAVDCALTGGKGGNLSNADVLARIAALIQERDEAIKAFDALGKSASRLLEEGFNEGREAAAKTAESMRGYFVDRIAGAIRALKREPKWDGLFW